MTTLTEEVLTALETKAKAALEDISSDVRGQRWQLHEDEGGIYIEVRHPEDANNIETLIADTDLAMSRATAEHVAEADPHAVRALVAEVRELRERVAAWQQAAVRNGDSRPTPESARAYLRNRESEVRRRDVLLGQAHGQVEVLASVVGYAIDCLKKTGLEADAAGTPQRRALATLEAAQAGVRQGKTLEDVLRELRHIDWRDVPVSNEALVYRLVDEFARRLGVEPEVLKTPDLARLEDALYAHDAGTLGVPPDDES